MQKIMHYLWITVVMTVWVGKSMAVDKDKLAKAKQFLNAKVTYIILKEYVNVKEKGAAEFQQRLQAVAGVLDVNDVANAPVYGKWKTLVDGNFPNATRKVCAYIDSIDERMLEKDPAAIAAAALGDSVFARAQRRYPEYKVELGGNKAQLVEKIDAYLAEAAAAPVTAAVATPVTETPRVPAVGDDAPGFFSTQHLSFWNLLAILLGIGTIVLLLISREKIRNKQDKFELLLDKVGNEEKKKTLTDAMPNNTYDQPGASSRKKNNTIFDHPSLDQQLQNNDIIKNLSREINDLKQALVAMENKTKSKPAPEVAPAPAPQVPDNIFFMAGPVGNYFPANAKSMTRDNTVYRFTVKDNRQEANYEIHTTGAPLNEIVSMRESYIVPACVEENIPGASVRGIKTTRPGTAILEGDKWIIKTKANIAYE